MTNINKSFINWRFIDKYEHDKKWSTSNRFLLKKNI